jgi:hypothetical protein
MYGKLHELESSAIFLFYIPRQEIQCWVFIARHPKEVKGKKNGAEKQKTETPADKEHNTSSYFSPGFSKS